MRAGFWWEKTQRERDHLLGLSIDGMMIFTLDCKATVLKLWTGFLWFGIEIGVIPVNNLMNFQGPSSKEFLGLLTNIYFLKNDC